MLAGLFPGLGPVLPVALVLSLYVSGHIQENRPIPTLQPLSVTSGSIPVPNMTITIRLEMRL